MKKTIILSLLIFIISMRVDAYDEKSMHPLINEKAALASTRFLSILYSLGYKENPPDDILYSNIVNGQKMKYWIRLGGTKEDDGFRYFHHFHDPTRTWDVAGLGGAADRYSSLLWAQNRQANNTLLTNEWSWAAARTYYYKALTEQAKPVREENLANSLRSLGQVMHLLADAAVPEHVRDDPHNGSLYEIYAKDHAAPFVENSGPAINVSITNTSLVANIIPISNFWDTTPAPITGNFIPVGLAEYTNYNFLSPDRMFDSYTYPVYSQNINKKLEIVDTGLKIYFSGTTSDGKPINRLYAASYLWSELEQVSPLSGNSAKFILDDKCNEDYASILVPKAVSYNAGLLDYFFRGTIEISLPDDGIYAITGPGGTFNKIKLKAKNTTANDEEMTGGTVQLVVKYKTAATDPFQPDYVCSPIPAQEFSYIVASEANGITSIPTTTTTLTFNLPGDGLPLWATDVYLQVVYKGQLGNEADAVAVGFKDISEPTPLDLRNDMDWVCINGVNYSVGSTEATAAFVATLGYVPTLPTQEVANDYLAFTQIDAPQVVSSTYYHAYFPSIDPGHYGRIYFLADYEVFYWYNKKNSDSATGYYGWFGLRNQASSCSTLTTERGLAEYTWHYFSLPHYPSSSVCPLIDDPLIGPVPVTMQFE